MKNDSVYLLPGILSKLRNQKGISQTELAQSYGCSTKNISDWESGKAPIKFQNCLILAEILDCNISDLATFPKPQALAIRIINGLAEQNTSLTLIGYIAKTLMGTKTPIEDTPQARLDLVHQIVSSPDLNALVDSNQILEAIKVILEA